MAATRDTTPVRLAGYLIAAWSILFGISCGILGDRVNSLQWQYLMSIPGGKWFWATVFVTPGVASVYGLWRKKYICVAIGMCSTGSFCLLIAALYFLQPLLDSDSQIITLGSWPWILSAISGIGVGAMNRNDDEW